MDYPVNGVTHPIIGYTRQVDGLVIMTYKLEIKQAMAFTITTIRCGLVTFIEVLDLNKLD